MLCAYVCYECNRHIYDSYLRNTKRRSRRQPDPGHSYRTVSAHSIFPYGDLRSHRRRICFPKLIIDRTVQYGQATAILLSGLMFALFHGNFNQFVYAFTLGVFWGFIYVKTGRLIYTVALHMTVNFLGSIPGLLLMKSTFFNQLSLLAENNPSAIVGLVMQHPVQFLLICFYMLLLFGLVITGIIFWAINFKKFKCAPGEITIPKGKRFSTIILNVGMILYCLFWIIQIILQLFA